MAVSESTITCDVLVAGGGPAGVPCALAAARCGKSVVLCQDRPVLGGNASSEVRMHIVGADASGWRGRELSTEAREGGIIEEIRLETAVRNPQRSASILDLILYDKCRAEPNLTLLLNTVVCGVEAKDNEILSAFADRQSTEERFRIRASVFVDCTGDGRLGIEAGAPFREGREAKDEFNESLARDEADRKRLGSSLLFQARDMGRPVPFSPPSWARKFSENDLRLRPHAMKGVDRGLEYGYWWVEWGGSLDTIKDNEEIRDELLAILLGVWDHIKNGGDHGAENWALDWFGFLPGKRESRRFVGQYLLREDDIMRSPPQPDAIAFGGWPIDTHPPDGVDAPAEPPAVQNKVPNLFEIPLRACVSDTIRNLMFAGRNISATHIAFAATRVMATCAAIGQGVGTAASVAIDSGLSPSNLASSETAMRAIQQRLIRDDAYLIRQINDDPEDLARSASVYATSEQKNGPAENVLTGQTRAVDGPRGVREGFCKPGPNRWMSDPKDGFPVILRLSWSTPTTITEVQIIFDTGMHRVLTLSHSDAYTDRMHWGYPQPETVRDYEIWGTDANGRRKKLVAVGQNYQRRCHHRFKEHLLNQIEIHVLATNGINHARIFEMRCYR